jgi:hypothetical protein
MISFEDILLQAEIVGRAGEVEMVGNEDPLDRYFVQKESLCVV